MALDVREVSDEDGKKSTAVGDPLRWWGAQGDRGAAALTAAAEWIEVSTWRERYMAFVCSRLMTGRGMTPSFGARMSERSNRLASSTWSATFNPPALNVVATSADVMLNKVFKNRPWLEWTPNRGDFKSKMNAKGITEYIDAIFHMCNAWPLIELCGIDCMSFGTGLVKVGRSVDAKSIELTRVLQEEILLMPEDQGSFAFPRSLIQRVFVNRDDAINKWGTYKGSDPDKRAKAENIARKLKGAQRVYPGFYDAAIQYKDIVALCEGWRLPFPDGTPGRRILAIDNVCLEDEKYTRKRFPFAKLIYQPLSNSWLGQGLAEVTLPLQREIDRVSTVIAEIERRDAWPRYAVESGSQVNPESFNGPGIVTYSQTAPIPLRGSGGAKDLYGERQTLIQTAFQRNGISPQQSTGEKPSGLSSGVAILAFNQLDDSRHVAISQRLEDFVDDIGSLILDEAEEMNPTVYVAGKNTVSWKDVGIERRRGKLKSFPMSRLPTLPSARLQQIENWFADGTITKATKLRLENVPDTQGYIDMATASENMVLTQIDTMIETGKYDPPIPYTDLASALQMAQSRYQQEYVDKTPPDRLRLLMRYIAQLRQMISKAAPKSQPMPASQPMPGAQAPAQPMQAVA